MHLWFLYAKRDIRFWSYQISSEISSSWMLAVYHNKYSLEGSYYVELFIFIYLERSIWDPTTPHLGTIKGWHTTCPSFVLPACSRFCSIYAIPYSLVLSSLVYISCTVPYHARILQPLFSSDLPLLYKSPRHIRYSSTLYGPRKVQFLCQNL